MLFRSWSPATIATGATGTFRYVFTPDGAVACAIGAELYVEVVGNTPPVALNDAKTTLQDVPVAVPVLANDKDSNGSIDASSVTIVAQPANGSVTINPQSGVVFYTPARGYTGTDTFTYSVCDDGIPCGPMCDTATVTIVVELPNNPPVARDTFFTIMCYPLIFDLHNLVSDPDAGDILRINTRPISDVQHGDLRIYNDGTFEYWPFKDYVGTDQFMYEVCDDGNPILCDIGKVVINVLPEADCDGLPDDDDDIPVDCALMIPEGFSPNADGVHDFFQIYCIDKYPEATLRIFDRAGNKLFQKHNYGNLAHWGSDENAWWWGISEHKLTLRRGTLPAGTYLYVLELGNGEVRTGTVMIAY